MKYKLISLSILAFGVASCTITPKPFETTEVSSYAQDKLERVTQNQEPITRAITLHEAMARAIKYNLDYRIELYDEVLKSKELASASLKGLPELVANSDYAGRNKYNASNSGSLPDPTPGSGNGSVSSPKNNITSDLTLSWNILDFGLSYVRAQQSADQQLIAREKRRRVINQTVSDVRTAYWRAVSADRLLSRLKALERRAVKTLAESEKLSNDGETSPLTALTYQRELVEIQQTLQGLQRDLAFAKSQLSALMNVKPNTKYKLSQPKRRLSSLRLPWGGDEMVHIALENRPEMLEIQYRERINSKEAKIALLELLPSLNLFIGANSDPSEFLVNNNWVGWGAKASWNLLKVFQYPARKDVIHAQDELLDQRALALTMATMTQIYVARARYLLARKGFATAGKHLNIQRKILGQIRASKDLEQASQQTLIREEMNTLVSEGRYDIAYADLQNSFANIFTSIGLDPYDEGYTGNEDVQTLTKSLRDLWRTRGAS